MFRYKCDIDYILENSSWEELDLLKIVHFCSLCWKKQKPTHTHTHTHTYIVRLVAESTKKNSMSTEKQQLFGKGEEKASSSSEMTGSGAAVNVSVSDVEEALKEAGMGIHSVYDQVASSPHMCVCIYYLDVVFGYTSGLDVA